MPGCSTGEEAYSLAILLTEVLDDFVGERHVQVQVFATDLAQEAIDVARQGLYSPQSVAGLSLGRLERFFTPQPGGFQVRSELRELIVFAKHNTFSDPPFTRLDLLSCRNLLIYFGLELQKQILTLFHYALKPGGLLFLGPSETLGGSRDLFATLDPRWKLYRRGDVRVGELPQLGPRAVAPPSPEQPSAPPLDLRCRAASSREADVTAAVQHLLLSEWAPPAVVVDAQGSVVYVSGHTGAYLELPTGTPSNNVVELALPALRYELGGALRAAVGSGHEVRPPNLTVQVNGAPRQIELIVRPLRLPDLRVTEQPQGLFLIVFQDRGAAADPGTERDILPERGDRTADLERELQATREYLRSTIEEMEVSLEERKSTNEELQTANEELTTINAEHQVIITDLQRANDDMKNLLDSLGIATVFLGNDLRIRRFTPGITQVINLMPVDVGRSLTDLASNLRHDRLADGVRQVLQTLRPCEAAVQTRDDQWFLIRISPYRTFDNFIDGVVVVFTDIGPLKRLEQELRVSLLYSQALLNTIRDPIIVLDHNLRVVSYNPALLTLLATSADAVQGERLYDLGSGQFDQPELVGHLRDVALGLGGFSHFMVEMDLPGRGPRAVKLNAQPLLSEGRTTELVLLWGEDVTPILEQVAESGAGAVHDGPPGE